MRITARTHPTLFEAFDMISHDSGGGCHTSYHIPEKYAVFAAPAESALKALAPHDLETFCIGEATEAEAIQRRSADLTMTNTILNLFFDGWSK